MAYVSQEMKKELAPKIKSILKKYGLKGTLSVRHHSTLVLTIKSGKLDFCKVFDDYRKEACARRGDEFYPCNGNIDVNLYHIDTVYNGKYEKCLSELHEAMKGPKFFDHTDTMTDYFHCSHYMTINIGKWDKPYIFEK